MANRFFKAMRADKNWLTISLFLIGVIILTITLFHGGVGALNPTRLFFFTGLLALFYAFLNPWEYRTWRYYTILLAVLVFPGLQSKITIQICALQLLNL
jgi:membrane protein YdbS with pleckstrin-like domain